MALFSTYSKFLAEKLRSAIVMTVLVAFGLTSMNFNSFADAYSLSWSPASRLVQLSPPFTPVIIRGMTIDPKNPFIFSFIIDQGNTKGSLYKQTETFRRLAKYFMAAMTVAEDKQWVNLSPYERHRIIDSDFGKTEMGMDLLEEDYMLKQITASLLYPDGTIGKNFWRTVYQQAAEKYGTTQIPVNTFNKVWILPDTASVYENGNTVLVVESHLKVILEEDYLSLQKHSGIADVRMKSMEMPRVNRLGSQILRQLVLPVIEKEVNEGKNFAILRQIYSGMILAAWYKQALRKSILTQIYANKNKVKGIDFSNPVKVQQNIYHRYLKAFKKGVYNFVKEETDPLTGQIVGRKYFSGGFQGRIKHLYRADGAMAARAFRKLAPSLLLVSFALSPLSHAFAQTQASTNPGGVQTVTNSSAPSANVKLDPSSAKPITTYEDALNVYNILNNGELDDPMFENVIDTKNPNHIGWLTEENVKTKYPQFDWEDFCKTLADHNAAVTTNKPNIILLNFDGLGRIEGFLKTIYSDRPDFYTQNIQPIIPLLQAAIDTAKVYWNKTALVDLTGVILGQGRSFNVDNRIKTIPGKDAVVMSTNKGLLLITRASPDNANGKHDLHLTLFPSKEPPPSDALTLPERPKIDLQKVISAENLTERMKNTSYPETDAIVLVKSIGEGQIILEDATIDNNTIKNISAVAFFKGIHYFATIGEAGKNIYFRLRNDGLLNTIIEIPESELPPYVRAYFGLPNLPSSKPANLAWIKTLTSQEIASRIQHLMDKGFLIVVNLFQGGGSDGSLDVMVSAKDADTLTLHPLDNVAALGISPDKNYAYVILNDDDTNPSAYVIDRIKGTMTATKYKDFTPEQIATLDIPSGEKEQKTSTPQPAKDQALISKAHDNLGGIDLNSSYLKFKFRRDENGVPLPLREQDFSMLSAPGFVAVITAIKSASDLPILTQLKRM